MKLFVPLVAAFILGGALAYEELYCVHQNNGSLCKYLTLLHMDNLNLEAIFQGTDSQDLVEAVSTANRVVLEAMNRTGKVLVFGKLRKIIVVETAVSSHLHSRCSEGKLESKVCQKARQSMNFAMDDLKNAILEVGEAKEN